MGKEDLVKYLRESQQNIDSTGRDIFASFFQNIKKRKRLKIYD